MNEKLKVGDKVRYVYNFTIPGNSLKLTGTIKEIRGEHALIVLDKRDASISKELFVLLNELKLNK
jgi:hypothetical protein